MREWYVIRLGRQEDTSKARIYSGEAQGDVAPEDEPQEVAPARELRAARRNEGVDFRNRINVPLEGFGLQQQPTQRQSQGFGCYVRPATNSDKSGLIRHSTREAADKYAEDLAKQNPKVMFGVFECVRVMETVEPLVIMKFFNSSDELIVVQPDNM